jgi:hypothetical protein
MNLTPEVRKSIYGLVAAGVPVLVIIGAISDDVAQQVLTIAAAVLAVGGSSLAFANVTPSKNKDLGKAIVDVVEAVQKSAGTGKVASSDIKKPAAKKATASTKKASPKK